MVLYQNNQITNLFLQNQNQNQITKTNHKITKLDYNQIVLYQNNQMAKKKKTALMFISLQVFLLRCHQKFSGFC